MTESDKHKTHTTQKDGLIDLPKLLVERRMKQIRMVRYTQIGVGKSGKTLKECSEYE